jgi:Ohr subfamily peroxiredoxin
MVLAELAGDRDAAKTNWTSKMDRTISPDQKDNAARLAGKVIYTAKTTTTGGRENGHSRSSDGQLDVKLSLPSSARIGTNPEQLFAAGWSACFESSMGIAAHLRKIAVPGIAVDAKVDLHLADGEYFISARFNINLPGLDRDIARLLVEDAEQICTYSKATRGNIDVVFNLV